MINILEIEGAIIDIFIAQKFLVANKTSYQIDVAREGK